MANIFRDSNLSYRYNLNQDGSINIPNIYLMDRRLKRIGQIEDVCELSIVVSFNEPNEISFTTHKFINGHKNSLWDKIKDNSIIKVEGFGLFEIETPKTEKDIIEKTIHGQDLSACELGQTNCTLEINTENDYINTVTPSLSDVKPTTLYNPDDQEHSLLHRILSYAPHYSIGHVDGSIQGMNRELSCMDIPVYDFLVNNVSEAFGCIFVFDNFSRVINAYDLKDHCLNCGSHHIIGTECQDCKNKGNSANNIEAGFGYNSTAYIDTENLATEITITGDKDSVKNCFKLEAGDDTMTEMVGQRLIGGTNYIWTFSNEMLNDMSDELREKYIAYTKMVDSYQSQFNKLWNNYNEYTNKASYYKDIMFPETESNITSASQALELIQDTITYACIGNKNTVLSTVSKSILNYAKLILPKDYGVKFEINSDGEDITSCTTEKDGNYNVISSWTGNIYIYRYNYTDDNGNDLDFVKSSPWTLPVKKGYQDTLVNGHYTNDYFLYLKQQLDMAIAKSKLSGKIKHDSDYTDNVINHLNDIDYYKNYFAALNVTSLQSYYDAYNTASVIINQLNPNISEATYIKSDGTVSDVDILHKLLNKYTDFTTYISEMISKYQGYVDEYNGKAAVAESEIIKINTICNLKNYLGNELYTELMSFKREDVYKNENFTSDMSDNDTDLLADIDEFILDAKEEIAKACQLSYTCTTTINNLFLDKNFNYKEMYDYVGLGNYVRLSVDDIPVKIRIIQITFNFDDNIEEIPISFSDALVGESAISDYQSVINSAKSMATSFNYIAKQSDKNNKDFSTVVGKLIDKGLAAINNMIGNATDISITIDEHGILGRKWNEDSQRYDDKQLRIINNCIAFTDNNWNTVKTAFGNIYFNGEWRYGLIADWVIGRMLVGENLFVSNDSGTYTIDNSGFNIIKGDNKILIDANTPKISINNGNNSIVANANNGSFIISNNGTDKLRYTPSSGLYLDGSGKFSGDVVAGSDVTGVHLYSSGAMTINANGNRVMDFNTNGNGKLVFGKDVELTWANITDGKENVTSITEDTIKTTNVIAEKLRVKAANIDGTLTATNINATTGTIGGWKINDTSLFNDTNDNGYIGLMSTGSVWTYLNNKAARLIGGKLICGSYDTTNGFNQKSGYIDMSIDGIFAKSLQGISNTESPYLFRVDIKSDCITMSGVNDNTNFLSINKYGSGSACHVKKHGAGIGLDIIKYTDSSQSDIDVTTDITRDPALRVIKEGSGSALQVFCTIGGSDSTKGYGLNAYGEYKYGRIVFRCDNGQIADYKAGNGVLGTTTFPWDTVYSTNGVYTSDLKEKDVISEIDKEKALEFINNLKPLNYTFKNSTSKRIHMGFGAQHVAETAKKLNMGDLSIYEAVIKDGSNEEYYQEGVNDENLSWGLKYNEFEAPMVSAIQLLSEKVTELEKEITELKKGNL